MTLIVAAVFSLWALVFASFAVDAGSVSTDRSRAQTAADAAALAAVAESAPHGSGRPEEIANRYAEMNGAEVVSCDCPVGALEVQVVVEVTGSRATARARIDPTRFAPAATTSLEGLHPELEAGVRVLVAAAGGAVHVVSGWRSSTRQAQLWSRALARYGDPEIADDWVARPGHSMHEKGLAVDLGGDLDLAARLIVDLRLPLYRPLTHEPWHFELRLPG